MFTIFVAMTTTTHGQLDGLFRGDAHELGNETAVEPGYALVTDHFTETIRR